MPKMHELLAVSDDQKNQANKSRTDLISTFTSKPLLFKKKISTFQSNAEGAKPLTEEQSDIQTTLEKELKWVGGFISKAIDSSYQIDIGNTQAKADLVVEGPKGPHTLATGVPATSLLQLEKQMLAVRELLSAMPTLDPAQGFSKDDTSEKGIWKARDVVKNRTRKEKKVLEIVKATDKHPAQAQVYDADVNIGTVLEQEWSSLTTPAIRAAMLSKVDELVQAIKKARSRANSIDLDTTGHKIGKSLLDYVLEPLS